MKPLIGKVVSNKNEKTVVVAVENKWQHPLYKKTVKRVKKYMAHDELGAEMGQEVVIVPSKPVSKMKRWKVDSIVSGKK